MRVWGEGVYVRKQEQRREGVWMCGSGERYVGRRENIFGSE